MVTLQDNAQVLVIHLDRNLSCRLKMAEDNPGVSAIVLTGNEFAFDCDDFDDVEGGNEVHDAFRKLTQQVERCTKPVVAALRGRVNNRGVELALSCHGRIADAAARIGFDGIHLGLIPGAGGTQRLPRLIGMEAAYDLIYSGQSQTAHQMPSAWFDAVVAQQVIEIAARLAQELAAKLAQGSSLPRTGDLQIDAQEAAEVVQKKVARLNARQKLQSVYMALTEALQYASGPLAEGLSRERELFSSLMAGNQARALSHQFQAERDAVQMPADLRVAPREVNTVAVIGAGTMGTGIAIAALDAGYQVILVEQTGEALTRGCERVRLHYAERVSAGKLKEIKAISTQQELSATTDWQLIARADLIVEAVFEELTVKQSVFAQLDAVAKPGAILATNTSYLDVDAIANMTSRPYDVIGLHFFSPANIMKLLEVVQGTHTSAQVLATGMAFGRKLNKVPVLCGNAFGFIGNRIYNAYRKQCEFMLEDGAWPEQVDQALTEFGFAMGPFAVADMSGLDIGWRMRKAQAATRDPRERYVAILDRLCEQGRLGQKTGMGYYLYQNGKRGKDTDSTVRAIIERARVERGILPRHLEAPAIHRRALLAMVNEAALLLAEGVAARPSDIDVVLVQGYGFPRWLGGPVFWARQQDRKALDAELDIMIRENGFAADRATSAMLDNLLAG